MQQLEPSDAWLMAAIAGGDEEALGVLYDRYHVKVFQVALSRLGDPELAEEVVDDVFMRCWEQAGMFRPDAASARSWLCRIADNRSIDVWRSKRGQARRHEEPLPDTDASHGTPRTERDLAGNVADQVTIAGCLGSLPEAQQVVIRFAYFGGLSQSEIAAVTGRPLGTVKTQTRTALDALRRCVGNVDEGSVVGSAP